MYEQNLATAKLTAYLYLLINTGSLSGTIHKAMERVDPKMFMDYAYDAICAAIENDPVISGLLAGVCSDSFPPDLTQKILAHADKELQKTIALFRNGAKI
jgi:hypothetical protein